MEKTSGHWGEIKEPHEGSYTPDVSESIERSMNKFCLAEFDEENDEQNQKCEEVSLQCMDPLMMYAISLHKHANDITEMIRVAEVAIDSHLIPPEDAIPPIPEPPVKSLRHVRNSLNFIPKQFTAFSLGKEVDIPELSSAGAKQILYKCVATMTAHIGFETTHQSILDLLTDVLEEFFIKIGERVKIAQEDEQKGKLCGFPNVIERVLTETGLGGVKGLHEYYQSRVIKYIRILQKRCNELNDHYAKLLIPKCVSPIDNMNRIIRVKVEEEESMESDTPEVHFPIIDGEVGLSSLETGYQLLNSLEAEANLQSIVEGDEDITVNASPNNVVSIPETELIATLSPFTKKKRR